MALSAARKTFDCRDKRAATAAAAAAFPPPSELSTAVKERVCHRQTRLVPRPAGWFVGEGQKKNKKSVGAFLGEKGRGEAGERCRRRCMRMMQPARDGAFRREELLGSWRKCQLDSKPVRRTISIVLVTGGEIIILQNVRLLGPVAGGEG